MQYVIIGAGPAGVTAAENLRKIDPDGVITVVGDEPEMPYSRMAIPYLLVNQIDERGTFLRKDGEHYKRSGIAIVQGKVVSVNQMGKNVSLQGGEPRPSYLQGSEREIAVLFADLRSFTQFAEAKLPYDVVFALNQYFRGMGQAVEAAGGHLDKFIGDGVMALFGVEDDLELGCRQALAAAAGMAQALEHLNEQLRHDLDQPLRMGIGVHAGAAIVGEMGYGPATSVTAVGDIVNTASRLETMTKEFTVQAVISSFVAERAGADLSAFEVRQITVRGRAETMAVHLVPDARNLPGVEANAQKRRRGRVRVKAPA